MKQKNIIIIIFFAMIFLLRLNVFSANASTFYFDSINGNDDTAQADNINKPFKTLPRLNWLLGHKVISSGDIVAFKKGTTQYEQVWRGWVGVGNDANPNITFTSYGNGNYKPILTTASEIKGWSGGPTVYTKTIDSFNSLLENRVPLKVASNSSCSDGYWYFSGSTLYYKPSDGILTGKLVENMGSVASFDINSVSNISVNGLGFYGTIFWVEAELQAMSGIIVTNCDFWAGSCLSIRSRSHKNISNVTVTDNTFKNSCGPSVFLCTNDNWYRSGLDNVYFARNRITDNNKYSDGSIWLTRQGDRDIIYGQNWGTAVIEDNIFDGDTGVDDFSAAIQCYQATGFSWTNGISSFSNNGNGLFRVISATQPNPNAPPATDDYVFIYGSSGTGAPSGKFKIIVINSTTFDLVGSTYVSGCSGGYWYTDTSVNADITIRRNIIQNGCNGIYMGASNGGIYESNRKYKIYNNIINNQSGYGIKVDLPTELSSSYIYNNTLHNCNYPFEMALGTKNILIKNNIASGSVTRFTRDDAMGNTWDYNCYQGAESGNVFKWGASYQSLSTWQGAGRDIHSINLDPKFMDSATGNFHLQLTSPLIDAGADVGLTSDFEGNPVPQGAASDIGAFEYASSEPQYKKSDLNQDSLTNVIDLGILMSDFMKSATSALNLRSDINSDGSINVIDLGIMMSEWGK